MKNVSQPLLVLLWKLEAVDYLSKCPPLVPEALAASGPLHS